LSDYLQEINGDIENYNSLNQMYSISVRSNYKKWPNITLGYQLGYTAISSSNEQYSMQTWKPNLILKYDFLKGFIFKADYSIDISQDKTSGQENRYDMSNASIFYQHKKSPWGFEFSAANIFNINAKYGNSVSNYLAISDKTYIFPRVYLFTVSYHL
jgi:hypothetical protein